MAAGFAKYLPFQYGTARKTATTDALSSFNRFASKPRVSTSSVSYTHLDVYKRQMHKSGGSLTQSSLLLIGPNVHPGYVRQIINLTQTTSGSYLLMSSLDISRRNRCV